MDQMGVNNSDHLLVGAYAGTDKLSKGRFASHRGPKKGIRQPQD